MLYFSYIIRTEANIAQETSVKNITTENISKSLLQGVRNHSEKRGEAIDSEEISNRAFLLWTIFNAIKDDEIFSVLEKKYEALKKDNDDYYNCHLLITLLKAYLLLQEYDNDQQIEGALKVYNMCGKINFTFSVIKCTTNNPHEVDQIKEFILDQQNVNFDVDKHVDRLKTFLSKTPVVEVYIPYKSLYFVSKYLGHVKIPSEYNEVRSFLKNYGYFVYGEDKNEAGVTHTYYILSGVKEGKPLTIENFKKKKAQELYIKFLMNLLRTTKTQINNKKVMEILDREIAITVFQKN